MANDRLYSPADRLLLQADMALRTLLPFSGQPSRPSPPSSSRKPSSMPGRPAISPG